MQSDLANRSPASCTLTNKRYASMWKLVVVFTLALALGLAVGWWLRAEMAIDACVDSGGKWLPEGGYCVGSKFGEMQI